MENNKTPEIRFAGFSDGWEKKKLRDITEEVSGNDGSINLSVLTISAQYGWMDQKERFSQVIAGNELKNYTLLRKGELSYNHGNSKLAKYGVVFELRDYEKALVPKVYHSFKSNNNSDPSFLEYLFSSKIPDRELEKLVTSSARMDGLLNINKQNFFGITLFTPKVDEQIKIGNFFKQLDDIISLHQRELDKLKQMKQGFLQKMFPKEGESVPELRFPGFKDKWKECKIDDLLKINSGRDYKHLQKGTIPVYGTGGYMLSVNDRLSDDDAIGIGRKGTIDKPQLLKAPFWTVDTLFYMTVKKNASLSFCYSLTTKIDWKKYDESTGVPSLSKSSIANISVNVPSIQEQVQIGNFFKQLDTLINLHQQELDLLKQTKKAFLQKMFI